MINDPLSPGCMSCLTYALISLILFFMLGLMLPPGFCIFFMGLWFVSWPIYKLIKRSNAQKEEREKNKKLEDIFLQQKEDFIKEKEVLISNVLKWEKDGPPAIFVKDKALNKYNKVYFVGDDFYLKLPGKSIKVIRGSLMFSDKEVSFISNEVVKILPFRQTLKVDIGPCEIRFTHKKYHSPLSFFKMSKNHYADRLLVCRAYALWYILNGFERNDFMSDLEEIFNAPMPSLIREHAHLHR